MNIFINHNRASDVCFLDEESKAGNLSTNQKKLRLEEEPQGENSWFQQLEWTGSDLNWVYGL